MPSMKFLRNLYRIVESEKHPSITWNEKGNGILILDKQVFIAQSLPSICKSDEYGTFVRQLNNYGFSKTKQNDIDEFVHPRFLKGKFEEIEELKRKNHVKKQPEFQLLHHNQQVLNANILSINDVNKKLVTEVYHLKERVNQQERTINELISAFIRLFNKQEPTLLPLIERRNGANSTAPTPDTPQDKEDLPSLSSKDEQTDIDHFLNEELDRL